MRNQQSSQISIPHMKIIKLNEIMKEQLKDLKLRLNLSPLHYLFISAKTFFTIYT